MCHIITKLLFSVSIIHACTHTPTHTYTCTPTHTHTHTTTHRESDRESEREGGGEREGTLNVIPIIWLTPRTPQSSFPPDTTVQLSTDLHSSDHLEILQGGKQNLTCLNFNTSVDITELSIVFRWTRNYVVVSQFSSMNQFVVDGDNPTLSGLYCCEVHQAQVPQVELLIDHYCVTVIVRGKCVCECVCVCVYMCVRACMRACVRACVCDYSATTV